MKIKVHSITHRKRPDGSIKWEGRVSVKSLSPAAQNVIEGVRVLRQHTEMTGVETTTAQDFLIEGLNEDDIWGVLCVLFNHGRVPLGTRPILGLIRAIEQGHAMKGE